MKVEHMENEPVTVILTNGTAVEVDYVVFARILNAGLAQLQSLRRQEGRKFPLVDKEAIEAIMEMKGTDPNLI